ncbi:cyanophycinase [Sphaerospermopsis aphanizomenoides BCCUSP55]|uniref:cyanophycinase n=1 Tax=Sphaerospermopsis aphanizomenoides TaxID=459663 RepID=UPI00190329E1|nr:cyanophycinase [Sphaerospermopsis aphanizomenoides]MBK1986823.1 cyanophycinase [Sphaerospermopsis aphanizomenoides BCCUSP55]
MVRQDFDYIRECGKVSKTSAKPTPGILLIGGAEGKKSGEDAATQWFLKRADRGNLLVLRCGGLGRHADWVCDYYRDLIGSAAELSIDSREAADDPEVIEYIREADALFIAGGDQNAYEDYWEGTAVEDAINYLINEKKIPIAGTSAGMAILGDYYYVPSHRGVISSEILDDPFHHNTKDIYRSDFIRVPYLKNVITDTHLDRVNRSNPETRYGRLFGLLTRVVHDSNRLSVFAIGLEEGAFVAIDDKGIAKVFGNGSAQGQDAYFLQTNGALPEKVERDLPVIWNHNGQAVKVYKIAGTPEGSGHFDLNNWSTASGGSWEYWFTTGGYSGFKRHPIDN